MDIVQNMDDIKEEIEDEKTDVENHCLTLVSSNGEDHNERYRSLFILIRLNKKLLVSVVFFLSYFN
jgi:hypothetical protein